MEINSVKINSHEAAKRCEQAADWLQQMYFDKEDFIKRFSISDKDIQDEIKYLKELNTQHADELVRIYQDIARYAYHYIECLDRNGEISEWWDKRLRQELKVLHLIQNGGDKT